MESNATRTYPLPCPSCRHAEGRPLRVTTVKGELGQVVIDMQCHGCKHDWKEIVGMSAREQDRLD